MKSLYEDCSKFFGDRLYSFILFLVGISTYGYVITHYSIGIDDTAILLYFDEGLAPYMGRWTLYLLNKVFPLTQMSPFLIEFVSMIIMLFSATIWCVLWKKMLDRIVSLPKWMYALAAGVFISCPLISEVYVYYLHNGICLAYALTGVAVYALFESLKKENTRKEKLLWALISILFLMVALGCYESMLMVFVMGAILLFFLVRISYGKKEQSVEYDSRIIHWILIGFSVVFISMLLRSSIVNLLHACNEWDVTFQNFDSTKRGSLLSMFQIERSEAIVNLKNFFVKFFINGLCHLPITMLLTSYFILGILALISSVIKKDGWILLSIVALPVLPITMCVLEEAATSYRASVYVPMIISFAVLMVATLIWKYFSRKLIFKYLYTFLIIILLWSQSVDMNHWFVVDYLKYQIDKEIMLQVAKDLSAECDVTKPIVFRGATDTSTAVTQSAVLPFSDKRYKYISFLCDTFVPGMKEQYCSEQGYIFKEDVFWSTINWGIYSFDYTPKQLIRFWEMHGYVFVPETNLDAIKEAEEIRSQNNMPEYPTKGYILECDDYIIVNF